MTYPCKGIVLKCSELPSLVDKEITVIGESEEYDGFVNVEVPVKFIPEALVPTKWICPIEALNLT